MPKIYCSTTFRSFAQAYIETAIEEIQENLFFKTVLIPIFATQF